MFHIIRTNPSRLSAQVLIARCLVPGCSFLLSTMLCTGFAYGQRGDAWSREYYGSHCYSPRTALSSYVHAQADLMRAQGRRAVDFAQARVLLAEAVDKDLDNWLKHMQTYWQRRIDYEQNRIVLNQIRQVALDQRLNNRRAVKSRKWERIQNNPELNGPSIVSGTALNFLLDQLANTVGTYDIANLQGQVNVDDFAGLQLTPEQLHAVQLYQTGVHGGKLTFRADGSSNVELDWWPFLLRGDEFKVEREAYIRARRTVVEQAESGGSIDMASLNKLKNAYAALSTAFLRRYVAQEQGGADNFRQFSAARAFLHGLGSELQVFENTGNARALQVAKSFRLDRDGHDVLSLLAFMNRNGVRFAPAQPGDEFVYHALFRMMRDMYVVVADNDESIQPRDLTEQLR
jgi:hypothetical protein